MHNTTRTTHFHKENSYFLASYEEIRPRKIHLCTIRFIYAAKRHNRNRLFHICNEISHHTKLSPSNTAKLFANNAQTIVSVFSTNNHLRYIEIHVYIRGWKSRLSIVHFPRNPRVSDAPLVDLQHRFDLCSCAPPITSTLLRRCAWIQRRDRTQLLKYV